MDKQAFRLGFARELAARGISPAQLNAALEKRAQGSAVGGALAGAGKVGGEGIKALSGLAKALVGLGLVGVPLAGLGIGWGLGRSKRTSPADLEAMKEIGLTKEYEEAVRRLRRRKQIKESAVAATGPTADRIQQAKQKVTMPVPQVPGIPRKPAAPARVSPPKKRPMPVS